VSYCHWDALDRCTVCRRERPRFIADPTCPGPSPSSRATAALDVGELARVRCAACGAELTVKPAPGWKLGGKTLQAVEWNHAAPLCPRWRAPATRHDCVPRLEQ
jgi:hypothetical protein